MKLSFEGAYRWKQGNIIFWVAPQNASDKSVTKKKNKCHPRDYLVRLNVFITGICVDGFLSVEGK